MPDFGQIEVLKLHSLFLERNKELVEAIRDKQPGSVVAAIFNELRQVCAALHEKAQGPLF